jgi:hypothetical protein
MKFTFKGDRAHYLPVQVEVKPPGSMVLPSQVVEDLIRESSFRFILHRCLCRSLEPCQHFSPEIGCLFLGEGAREIDPSLGREASVEEALSHHRKALDSGLIPMAGKLRWDSVWLGVKQEDQLLTICHCCDCCCYFKLYRFLPPEAARGLQKMEGLEVRVGDACDGCGICVERCFIQAMQLQTEGRGGKTAGDTALRPGLSVRQFDQHTGILRKGFSRTGGVLEIPRSAWS